MVDSLAKRLIISGISTDVGKSVVAAIAVRTLSAIYWKPISCAPPGQGDRDQLSMWLRGEYSPPESYAFPYSVSPHEAAERMSIEIDLNRITPPSKEPLVLEMAGGLLSPVYRGCSALDLFQPWGGIWVVVVRPYLGCINHTALTLEVLRSRGIEPWGVVISGSCPIATERWIVEELAVPVVGRLEECSCIGPEWIERQSERWKQHSPWKELRRSWGVI